MGVDARVVVYAKSKTNAEDACSAAFKRIAELDSMMSDYRKDSELMRLCAEPAGNPVKVSPELFQVVKKSIEFSKATNGKFDITVGPLVALWRKARKTAVLPTETEINEAKKLVGYQKISLNSSYRTIKLAVNGMKLDLGGIAKGYADDEAQKVLKKFGITSALVEMGGDIVVSSPPPGTKGWTISVPNAGENNTPKEILFKNCAVSTSGDTEQFVVIGGKKYSHVVDPKSGYALTNGIQATVVAKNGLLSDPLSKVAALIDPEAAKKLLKAYGIKKSYVRVLPFK